MTTSKIQLHVVVEKDPQSGWYTASCPDLPGCITQAETEAELTINIKEAVTQWYAAQAEKKMPAQRSSSDVDSSIHELFLAI